MGLPTGEICPKYRHKKRGTTYTVMARARMQVEDSPLDMQWAIVYMSDADGSVWVRPEAEFFDGRFEKI